MVCGCNHLVKPVSQLGLGGVKLCCVASTLSAYLTAELVIK